MSGLPTHRRPAALACAEASGYCQGIMQETGNADVTGPVRVRFAPSPTGYLHTGGARTALFNWLFARRHGGTFILRIEDTDAARNTPQALAAIFDGLRWLGIDWDEGPDAGGDCGPYFQSQRKEIYDRYLDQLVAKGLTYTEENGAVRFRSPKVDLVVDDRICGPSPIKRTEEPDMTIRRPDGSYIFHFVNVVDDIEMKITHVIRGADHLMNTAKHIELFQAFGVEPPMYAHIPLILNAADGSKMSKRDSGSAVHYYMNQAFVPAAVVNYLCLLGWSPKDDREVLPIDEVVRLFRWENLNNVNAKFDLEKCRWMNGQYLAAMGDEAFAQLARAWLAGAPAADDPDDPRHASAAKAFAGAALIHPQLNAFLALIRPKIRLVPEILRHLTMLLDDTAAPDAEAAAKVTAQPDYAKKLTALASHLKDLSAWDHDSVTAGIAAAAAECAVKPGGMMLPLRFAVTGSNTGVDLMPALLLLGQQTVVSRIQSRLPA